MKRYLVSRPRNMPRNLWQSGTTPAAARRATSLSIVPNALLRSSATQHIGRPCLRRGSDCVRQFFAAPSQARAQLVLAHPFG